MGEPANVGELVGCAREKGERDPVGVEEVQQLAGPPQRDCNSQRLRSWGTVFWLWTWGVQGEWPVRRAVLIADYVVLPFLLGRARRSRVRDWLSRESDNSLRLSATT